MNFFESPFKGVPLDQQIRNPNIRAGCYSYYSGYYLSLIHISEPTRRS